LGGLLRQPLIVAFIGVGILVGPWGLDLLESIEKVHLMAELGIAILLFVIGLKLDVKLIRSTGKVALVNRHRAGIIYFFLWLPDCHLGFGFSSNCIIICAVALTFSSTIIIVKLLSDKKRLTHFTDRFLLDF
jgi:Kef-type K+ transport system membrane component KefB